MVTLQSDDEHSRLLMDMINNILIEVLATLAEQELKRLRKRQHEGIEQAKANGVKFGRKPLVIPENFDEVYHRWKNKEMTAVQAFSMLNMSKSSFYKVVRQRREDK